MVSRIYRVVIPAPPRPKQRARSSRASGAHYTPKETVNQEAWVRLCCTQQVGTPCLAGPVAVRIGIFRLPPANMPKAQRAAAAALDSAPVTKPDWDNVAKLAADALNGIAWRDDAVVVSAEVVKSWCPPGGFPATVVEFWQLGPGDGADARWRLWRGPDAGEAASGLL